MVKEHRGRIRQKKTTIGLTKNNKRDISSTLSTFDDKTTKNNKINKRECGDQVCLYLSAEFVFHSSTADRNVAEIF